MILCMASCIAGCNKDPLITDLGTRKLIVVLKGTYESNNPAPWNMPAVGTADYTNYMQDDSVYECSSVVDPHPAAFMIDLAEIKLLDTNNHAYKFANYRQYFASGLSDDAPMFNGVGYPLANDDVPDKSYYLVALYIRKMMLDGAKSYTSRSTGWASQPTWDVYAESEFPIYNFNALQIHSYWDTLRLESTSINRVYPLLVAINDIFSGGIGMLYNSSFSYTVLEIRMVVKNYIKKYEQKTSSINEYGVTHFHALSDWLNDVEKDDTVMGGNVIAVARTYVPELVGTISGMTTAGRHVIAIPAGANIDSYTINRNPYGATATAKNTLRSNNPCNLPKAPAAYLGTNTYQALDYFLKSEKFKYYWNAKVPGPGAAIPGDPNVCNSYEVHGAQWDRYVGETNAANFTLPQLAVYSDSGTGAFSIHNVMPGTYTVYVANRDPRYGELYYDGEFTQIGTVSVTPGAAVTVP